MQRRLEVLVDFRTLLPVHALLRLTLCVGFVLRSAFKSEKPSMKGRASRMMKVFGKSS